MTPLKATRDIELLPTSVARLISEGTDAQRIAQISSGVFIAHAAVEASIEELVELCVTDRRSDPSGALLTAESGMGKSYMISALARRIIETNKNDGSAPTDLVTVEPSWENGDPEIFLKEIAKALKLKIERRTPIFDAVVEKMLEMNLAALVIEDIHDLFDLPRSKILSPLKTIRRLINSTKIPIICTCLPDALHKVSIDRQLDRRLIVKVAIPNWSFDENFREFITELEKHLPLRGASGLATKDIMQWLLKYSSTTFWIVRVIQKSAIQAIREGSERITLDKLKESFTQSPHTTRSAKDAIKRRSKKFDTSQGLPAEDAESESSASGGGETL